MLNKYGYVRVATSSPEMRVADVSFNTEKIIEAIKSTHAENCKIIVFPELCVTGYTCGDLFYNDDLNKQAMKAVSKIAKATPNIAIIGAPVSCDGRLYNCAIVINQGRVEAIIPKTYLPNRSEFYEGRWFTSGLDIKNVCIDDIPFGTDILINTGDFVFGVELCEDLWAPVPPSSYMAVSGAQIIFNLSASNDLVGKANYRRELVKQQSARTMSGYVYTSSNPGESTTDTVYSGHMLICENGVFLNEYYSPRFIQPYIYADIDVHKLGHERVINSSYAKSPQKEYRRIAISFESHQEEKPKKIYVNPSPFVPKDTYEKNDRCEEIIRIQSLGLAKRLMHTDIKKVVIGISGGLDSTLALIVCREAFNILKLPMSGIQAVTMPGFGTTERTEVNAKALVEEIGATFKCISIVESVTQHLKDIGHSGEPDLAYENAQARERTQILMDIANMHTGLVVGTGDLSEIALGWCTFAGDHISMYNVNAGVPKTLVKHLISWYIDQRKKTPIGRILQDILDTPISPELLPPDKNGKITQETEKKVGPYELNDFFLYHFVRNGFTKSKIRYLANCAFENKYSDQEIDKWLSVFFKRFFANQFKRSMMPDGPKVGSVALSPRADWRMPSDAEYLKGDTDVQAL